MKRLLLFIAFFLFLPLPEGTAQDGTEEMLKEVEQAQQQLGGLLEQIQRMQSANATGMEKAQQKVLTLAQDSNFLKAMGELWSHEKRTMVLLVNLGFFLLMALFKAWRQSKAKNWFTRMLIGMGLSLFTWFGMLVVIPLIIFGEPYRVFFLTLGKTFFA